MLSTSRIRIGKLLSAQAQQGWVVANCSKNASSQLPAKKPSENRELAEKANLPIERRSLARGLSLNKFEKDFMIFPEYTRTEDVESIKKYVKEISSELETSLACTDKSQSQLQPARITEMLAKKDVFMSFIHSDYGGQGFCQKGLMLLTEALAGDDISTFTVFNQAQCAAALIQTFGTAEQKEKYLPKIARNQCRTAICIQDEGTADSDDTIVLKAPGQDYLTLNGTKINVINADCADVFIVFANRVIGDVRDKRCYIIDREEAGGSIDTQERIHTQGLNGVHYSKVRFTDVKVEESCELGAEESIDDILSEVTLHGKTFYGAAVCGSLKKLIAQLCEFSNSRMEGNLRLSDTHPVQTAISELAVGVFVLESMVYYVAGLIDENLFLLNDVENSIIQRYANKIIRKAIVTMCDVAGMAAADESFEFEKMIRDLVTLTSTTESDLSLVRKISLPAIEAYIQQHGSMSRLMTKLTFTKMLQGQLSFTEMFKNPKPTHFIAEHVHPSLAGSAAELEKSMNRLSQVIDRLVSDKGVYIKTDYVALKNLATVMENNLGMVASIARASRSYSIGLRNAEDELAWANFFCASVSNETEGILKEVIDFFGIIKMSPKLTGVGKAVLDARGYSIENPIERNW